MRLPGGNGTGVRRRVTAVASIAVTLILLVVAAGVALGTRQQLLRGLDETLLQRSAQLAELAEQGLLSRAVDAADETAWQLVSVEGDVLASSDVLEGVGPVLDPLMGGLPPRILTLDVDAGEEFDDAVRVVARDVPGAAVDPEVDRAATLFVFAEVEDVDEAVGSLLVAFAVALPAAVLLLGWLVWVLVGRALAPVEQIRSQVATISGSDLDRRVPVPPADDEVARLAATMNRMLDRLEASAAAQRRFVSDASHELRSPLTRLRSQLETARPDDDVEDLRASLLEDAGDLQDLVEDLLLLARVDEGRAGEPSRVDLDEVVLAEVARARAVAQERRADGAVELDASGVSGAEVLGDRNALRRVVRNLLDNAVRHATTRVEVSLTERGGDVELVVADDGPGIPATDVQRIFERFTRLDDARTRRTGGSGLGLAIVREVSERHGGHVEVVPGSRGRFVVVLPGAAVP